MMESPSEIQRRGADERASASAAQSPTRRSDGQSVTSAPAEAEALTIAESWVEIASQPSSSSLSSIGDEIVTTGLRVGGGQAHAGPQRRRRLLQQHLAAHRPPHVPRSPAQGFTSSQEEYDETESEEDRLMASSAEHIQRPTTPGLPAQPTAIGPAVISSDEDDDDDDDDDDDRATALGKPSSSPIFRPQPNAFSHPPSHLQRRSHSSTSAPPHHPPFGRPPPMGHRSQTRVQRSGPNFMSPSYREDNDAALRASLTTLLSCAAAARGLSKKDETVAGPSRAEAGLRPSTQPTDLRLVSEATLMAGTMAAAAAATTAAAPSAVAARTASNSSAPSRPASASSRGDTAKTKRAASSASPATKPARAIKKKKTTTAAAVDADASAVAFLSPTVLTWVVSAGVVVLVSVVSFGAGYVIGREVGAQEASVLGAASSGTAANASSCGSEIVRSTSGGTLRRFRWGAGMARSVAA